MTRFIRHTERARSEHPRAALDLLMHQMSSFALLLARTLEEHPAPESPQTEYEATRQQETAAQSSSEAGTALRALLEAQQLEVAAKGTEPEQALFQEIQYLKVALADELLLHSPWAGQSVYLDSLLEVALFRTSRAGQEVIDRIERLISTPTESAQALAPLYLLAMNLGFQGKLRPLPQGVLGEPEESSVQTLKRALFRLCHHRDPEALHSLQRASSQSQRVVSEQAYQHTLQNMIPVRSWRLTRTGAWMLGWVLGLLVFSQLGWVLLSSPLRSALEFDQATSTSMKGADRGE